MKYLSNQDQVNNAMVDQSIIQIINMGLIQAQNLTICLYFSKIESFTVLNMNEHSKTLGFVAGCCKHIKQSDKADIGIIPEEILYKFFDLPKLTGEDVTLWHLPASVIDYLAYKRGELQEEACKLQAEYGKLDLKGLDEN